MKLCTEIIKFGDDYGYNSCTFHCGLLLNHIGQHEEIGTLYGKKYRLVWEGFDKTEINDNLKEEK